MSNKEKSIINPILLEATKLGARLFRQNVGRAWVGKMIGRDAASGTVTLAKARPFHAGLCKGSSDIIGWVPMVITSRDVGRVVAVFTAVEVKTEGIPLTEEQDNFLKAVRHGGGHGLVMKEGQSLIEFFGDK